MMKIVLRFAFIFLIVFAFNNQMLNRSIAGTEISVQLSLKKGDLYYISSQRRGIINEIGRIGQPVLKLEPLLPLGLFLPYESLLNIADDRGTFDLMLEPVYKRIIEKNLLAPSAMAVSNELDKSDLISLEHTFTKSDSAIDAFRLTPSSSKQPYWYKYSILAPDLFDLHQTSHSVILTTEYPKENEDGIGGEVVESEIVSLDLIKKIQRLTKASFTEAEVSFVVRDIGLYLTQTSVEFANNYEFSLSATNIGSFYPFSVGLISKDGAIDFIVERELCEYADALAADYGIQTASLRIKDSPCFQKEHHKKISSLTRFANYWNHKSKGNEFSFLDRKFIALVLDRVPKRQPNGSVASCRSSQTSRGDAVFAKKTLGLLTENVISQEAAKCVALFLAKEADDANTSMMRRYGLAAFARGLEKVMSGAIPGAGSPHYRKEFLKHAETIRGGGFGFAKESIDSSISYISIVPGSIEAQKMFEIALEYGFYIDQFLFNDFRSRLPTLLQPIYAKVTARRYAGAHMVWVIQQMRTAARFDGEVINVSEEAGMFGLASDRFDRLTAEDIVQSSNLIAVSKFSGLPVGGDYIRFSDFKRKFGFSEDIWNIQKRIDAVTYRYYLRTNRLSRQVTQHRNWLQIPNVLETIKGMVREYKDTLNSHLTDARRNYTTRMNEARRLVARQQHGYFIPHDDYRLSNLSDLESGDWIETNTILLSYYPLFEYKVSIDNSDLSGRLNLMPGASFTARINCAGEIPIMPLKIDMETGLLEPSRASLILVKEFSTNAIFSVRKIGNRTSQVYMTIPSDQRFVDMGDLEKSKDSSDERFRLAMNLNSKKIRCSYEQ